MGAALLVLLGLGLFVAGVLTGGTAYYWACVVACLGAAGLLFVARRRMAAEADAPEAEAPGGNRAEAEEDSEPAAATPAPPHGSLLRLGAHGRRAAQGEPAGRSCVPSSWNRILVRARSSALFAKSALSASSTIQAGKFSSTPPSTMSSPPATRGRK